MSTESRRSFLKKAAGATAALSMPYSRVLGANSDVRLGIVGVGSKIKIGGKGSQEIEVFRKMPGVRVVALCDPDSAHLDREVAKFKKRNETVKTYRDVRDLLDSNEIDAIVNATPNHWHALATIWACQAGKDVFVEKPASHNIFEGRKMVEAARKYNRIVQSGSGPRGKAGLPEAFEFARKGGLGRILCARGINYKPRPSIGKVPGPQPLPKTLDYDLWSGPAKKAPLMREYLHYDWHWEWPTGDGDLGNMGIHFMDGCRWALGYDRLPTRVLSFGGRFGYEDDGETPNTMVTLLDYEPAPILFEVRGLPQGKEFRDKRWNRSMDKYRDVQMGVIIECEDGWIADNIAYDKDGKVVRRFEESHRPLRDNFIDAVRSRNTAELRSEILEGHLSASLVHMANISYRVGAETAPNQLRLKLQGQDRVLEAFDRFKKHLVANGVTMNQTPAVLGPTLSMNPETERFTGDFGKKANRLVSRAYRKPYIVPEKV